MCTVIYPVGQEFEFHAPFVAIVVGKEILAQRLEKTKMDSGSNLCIKACKRS